MAAEQRREALLKKEEEAARQRFESVLVMERFEAEQRMLKRLAVEAEEATKIRLTLEASEAMVKKRRFEEQKVLEELEAQERAFAREVEIESPDIVVQRTDDVWALLQDADASRRDEVLASVAEPIRSLLVARMQDELGVGPAPKAKEESKLEVLLGTAEACRSVATPAPPLSAQTNTELRRRKIGRAHV